MQGLLENARGYAGTTLLGDGRVLLVLDVKELLP
jgi:two-component system, chemotaxis family, sensor kinase CheA